MNKNNNFMTINYFNYYGIRLLLIENVETKKITKILLKIKIFFANETLLKIVIIICMNQNNWLVVG